MKNTILFYKTTMKQQKVYKTLNLIFYSKKSMNLNKNKFSDI